MPDLQLFHTDGESLGGLSQFSSTEGLAADTVQNFEVVLGDGRVVNANAQENCDLWWALKGGGNNFGMVHIMLRFSGAPIG